MIRRPIRTLAAASTALLLAVVLAFTGAGTAAAAASDTYEADAIRATNAERTARGRVALRGQACLDLYAERLAVALAKEQRLRHSNLSTILRACKLRTVGENVAYGYGSGRAVVTGWMGSSGHRANILNPSFRLIGLGAVQDARGRWWVAQTFGA